MFDKIAVGETKSAEVYVMAMLQDDLTVSDPELFSADTRDKFDVKIEPVERDELPNQSAKRRRADHAHRQARPADRPLASISG